MLYQAPPNLYGYFVGTKEDIYLIYESGLRPLSRADEINLLPLAFPGSGLWDKSRKFASSDFIDIDQWKLSVKFWKLKLYHCSKAVLWAPSAHTDIFKKWYQ